MVAGIATRYPEAMKKQHPRVQMVLAPLAASLFLASCVSYPEQSAVPHVSARSGYTTYVSLPSGYMGDAYYYNNRYYAGGRYEPGTYSYQGRTYDHRYYHDGQYLYGGNYRQQVSEIPPPRSFSRPVQTYETTRW
jgi:hypothetical protein